MVGSTEISHDLSEIISESVDDLFIIINNKLEYEYINKNGHLKELGYYESDLISKSILNYIHPDEVKIATKFLKKIFKTGSESEELRIQHKDGHFIWYSIKGRKYNDNNTKTKAVLVSRDISHFKNLINEYIGREKRHIQLTEALPEIRYWKLLQPKKCITAVQKSREMLENVIDYIPELIFWKDKNLTYLGCNKNFAILSGIDKPENIVGKINKELKGFGKNWREIEEYERTIMKNDTPEYHKIETYISLGRENEVWFDVNRVPLHDTDGEVVGILCTYDDITDRIVAEQKLKESEEKYRKMIKNLDLGFFQTDINGKILNHNPSLNKILGYEPNEKLTEFYASDFWAYPEELENYIEDLKKKEGLFSFIHKAKKKNGEEIILQVHSHLYKNEGKNALEIEGTVNDITEKFALEQKLIESEEKYRHLFENSPFGILLIDPDGNLVDCNSTFLKNFKIMSKQEILEKNFLNIISLMKNADEIAKLFLKRRKAKLRGEFPKPIDFQVILHSDESIWFHWQSSFVNIENRMYTLAMIEDITAKKEAEEKLKESEELFRTMTEQSFMSITIIQDGIIQYVNEATTKIFGYGVEEMTGWKAYKIFKAIHPEDLQIAMEKFRNLEKGDISIPATYRYRLITKSGEIKWCDSYSKFIQYRGRNAILATVVDVTEKQIAEQKIKESEEKLKMLNRELEQKVNERTKELREERNKAQNYLDIAGVMIVVINSNQNVQLINKKGCEILGYEDKEIIGKNWFDNYIPKNERNGVKEIFQKIMSGYIKGVDYYENSIINKKEEERIIAWNNTLLKDNQGKIIGTLSSGEDITERKKAVRSLKESEEKYRLISENANDIIVILNKKFIIEYINEQTALRLLGYKKEDMIGRRAREFGHPDEFARFDINIPKAIQKGEGMGEIRFKHKNGSWIWLEIKGRVFRDNEGKMKLLLIGRDVTERKKTEQKLRESEEKFRTITEQSLLGICIIQNGFTRYVNKAISEINEYSIDEMKNMKRNAFIKSVHPDDLDFVWQQIQKRQKGGENLVLEYSHRLLTKTGKTKWVQIFSKPIQYRGQLADLITFVDISEQKEAEHKLKESEKKLRAQNIELKKLDKLKNDFITIAAHELKTPLSSIRGYTDLIFMQFTDMQPEMKDDLLRVKANIERLETYIKKLMDVMKIDAERMDITREKVNIYEIIKNCISDFKIQINNKNLNIAVLVDKNLVVEVDSFRIAEVFNNLIDNSIKFTPEYGKIEISAEIKDNKSYFKIKDTGEGLTQEDIKRLFSKFVMIEKDTDKFRGGSGLGLYITKGIIKAHSGEIWVNSEGKNKGSEFCFTLPLTNI